MKLPIKTKKDWCILFLVMFIALYYISMYYNFKIEKIMMRFAPDKMNLMNYPGGWGNLVLTGIIMTILVSALMIVQKEKKKKIFLAAGAGILFSVLMFAGYLIHTSLIVGTSKVLPADRIHISDYGDTNITLTEETDEGRRLTALAVSLKAEPKSKQKELKAKVVDREEDLLNIWISYPKKYGHSYDLILYVGGGLIYSYHGTGESESRIFYEDNGFYDMLQSIIKK
ncbi:hypothetical protein [Anaerocolumna sp. MB42-C2]|uniref:hypothetical protein n=1 Tax=Anaerocolumna sp. MB42-C2 TaxID=3070997 RepID=UPI0027E02694|nr:hypothetical protein [Anaerocolumna sp. MB42-C2]WMJ85641.1 hypothetical protein RBU59_16395 [Anaerocolumna sp. MB42-C2]